MVALFNSRLSTMINEHTYLDVVAARRRVLEVRKGQVRGLE